MYTSVTRTARQAPAPASPKIPHPLIRVLAQESIQASPLRFYLSGE